MNRYYTYLHYGKDNKPIYVGKGTSDRAYAKRDYGEPMSKRSPKDIRKFLEIVIDDACKGNDIAMSYIIKKLPKHTLNKIKELLETNSVKKYAI